MKKFDLTVSLGIIILCVLLMIMVGLRSCDRGGTAPSYSFLAGREPITCKIANRGTEDRRYIYSFEVDFNDICSKADAELIPDGFVGSTGVDKSFSDNGAPYRIYYLKEKFLRGPVWINIYDKRRCIKHTSSNNYGIAPKDGWIWVEVVYWRWQWPF
jgi:hypothetical protein